MTNLRYGKISQLIGVQQSTKDATRLHTKNLIFVTLTDIVFFASLFELKFLNPKITFILPGL